MTLFSHFLFDEISWSFRTLIYVRKRMFMYIRPKCGQTASAGLSLHYLYYALFTSRPPRFWALSCNDNNTDIKSRQRDNTNRTRIHPIKQFRWNIAKPRRESCRKWQTSTTARERDSPQNRRFAKKRIKIRTPLFLGTRSRQLGGDTLS